MAQFLQRSTLTKFGNWNHDFVAALYVKHSHFYSVQEPEMKCRCVLAFVHARRWKRSGSPPTATVLRLPLGVQSSRTRASALICLTHTVSALCSDSWQCAQILHWCRFWKSSLVFTQSFFDACHNRLDRRFRWLLTYVLRLLSLTCFLQFKCIYQPPVLVSVWRVCDSSHFLVVLYKVFILLSSHCMNSVVS